MFYFIQFLQINLIYQPEIRERKLFFYLLFYYYPSVKTVEAAADN